MLQARLFRYAFNLKTQSWALLADVFLSVMVAAASYSWRYLAASGWYHRWWWPVAAMGPAIMLVVLRVMVLDWPNFVKAGAEVLLYDPAKLGHDLVTYVVLPGLLVALAVPVFRLFITPPTTAFIRQTADSRLTTGAPDRSAGAVRS